MIFRKKIKVTVTALAVLLATSSTVFANPRYVDVPEDHWGHESIINVSDRGYMVGNTVGEFRPNSPMDKFDTSRILAMAAGFRHTGLSQEEELFIENAYLKHQELLESKGNQYVRWNPTANREIAFLLEKGILLPVDLDHFIVVNEGQEQLRALSRQEATVFLVRLMGLTEAAHAGSYAQLFNDDHNISPERRHYVYFLRANEVISGDANNNFNPNEAITRAAFAVMLDGALNLETPAISNNTYDNINSENITGVITVLYPSSNSLDAVQIRTDSNQSMIYRLSEDSVVFVNNFLVPFSSLEVDMNVSAIIRDGVIVDIRAVSPNSDIPNQPLPAEPVQPPTALPLPAEPVQPPTPEPVPQPVPQAPIVYQTIQGVIDSTNVDENTNVESIDVEIRFLTPAGSIVSQVITYNLAQTYEITRGGQDIAFDAISAGDIVTVLVSGNMAYEIDVAEPHRAFEGVLLEKKHNQILDVPVFIIEDGNGIRHEFIVTEDTILTREGSGTVTWNEIRIGDTVDLVANHTNLIEAYAFGTRSTVDGIVEEIRITQDGTVIVISNNNVRTSYYAVDELQGINRINVGNRVRLRLDSKEIESFSILQ